MMDDPDHTEILNAIILTARRQAWRSLLAVATQWRENSKTPQDRRAWARVVAWAVREANR